MQFVVVHPRTMMFVKLGAVAPWLYPNEAWKLMPAAVLVPAPPVQLINRTILDQDIVEARHIV